MPTIKFTVAEHMHLYVVIKSVRLFSTRINGATVPKIFVVKGHFLLIFEILLYDLLWSSKKRKRYKLFNLD